MPPAVAAGPDFDGESLPLMKYDIIVRWDNVYFISVAMVYLHQQLLAIHYSPL